MSIFLLNKKNTMKEVEMKYKIKRKRRAFKTSYIFVSFFIILIFLSISYARLSTRLQINGTVTGEQEQFDVFYLNIEEDTSTYPSIIGYMDTYSCTFTSSPTIECITMGGTRLTLNEDYTYSNGVLTIPNVSGPLVINGEEPELEDFKIKYVFGDNIEFDGSSWIDTDIALFSEDNFERDFEVTTNIVNCIYDINQNKKLNTILNCVDHKTAPYHGFLLRRDDKKYIFKVTNAKNTVTERNPSLSEVQNILITRENKKIYADLTNGVAPVEVGDLSNYTERIDSTLLVGSDINLNLPNRCFVGTMSNITVTNYYQAEEAPITLPTPNRTGYFFGGWFTDSNFSKRVGYGGESFTPKGDTTLYAKWNEPQHVGEEQDEYIYNGQYDFSKDDYINTNVYLYSEKNIHRNFEMSFDIVSLGSSSTEDTIMSATKNIVKISNARSELLTMITNGNIPTNMVTNIPDTITNIRLIRINDKLYYSFNGQTLLQINDYTGSTSYSNNPVLFGADFNSNGIAYRIFDGILENMSVKFIDDNVTLADYATTKGELATVYSHSGEYVFDGTNNIDTNIRLFDYDNYDKDFEISFNIVSIDSSAVSQSTIVNSKYENQSKGYPGFVCRLDSGKTKIELTAAKHTSGSPVLRNISEVEKIKISKRNMKLYLQINDEEEQQCYDFSGFIDFFNTTVTIGSSKDENGNMFRPFKGVLSDIVVKLEQ